MLTDALRIRILDSKVIIVNDVVECANHLERRFVRLYNNYMYGTLITELHCMVEYAIGCIVSVLS